MEDTLEAYLKLSKNKSEEPIIKKEVQITTQMKKEWDMRAMKIVEFSIEGKLRPEIFTRCLPYLTQSHYQDIVEERAVTKLCGYSVCGRRIPDMPKKQYYISTKSNKVYDITDRKNYCSNFCYKASLHIKKQIDDNPLWLRKLEDIPEYQLLESSDGGLPGEYIDQGLAKPVMEPTFTPVSVFTHASLQDLADNEKGKQKSTRKGSSKKLSKSLKSTMQTINETVEQIQEEEDLPKIEDKPLNISKMDHIDSKFSSTTALPVIDENEEKPETVCKPNILTTENFKENSESLAKSNMKKLKKKSSKLQMVDIESIVKKSLKEWLTLESYIFLYGENNIKEVLSEKKLSNYFEELHIAELRKDQQAKYMDICKRLQLQEMADDKFDNAILSGTKLNPVPNYQKLKEENKDLNVRVKCFYSGALYEKEDSNFHTKVNKGSNVSNIVEPTTVIPLVDVNSQNALRRKIFLTSVNKSMQQLLQAIRVTSFTAVLSDIQSLVKTFKLKPHNITFKPLIWNYIAIVLLNVLSIREPNIKNLLEEKSSRDYVELYLGSSSKSEFISDIMNTVQNIDSFVEQYISSC